MQKLLVKLRLGDYPRVSFYHATTLTNLQVKLRMGHKSQFEHWLSGELNLTS